jgi:hypothetical protein
VASAVNSCPHKGNNQLSRESVHPAILAGCREVLTGREEATLDVHH